MSIVYSQFFYGHIVTPDNRFIDFKEGENVRAGQIKLGSFSLEDYAKEIARAMNAYGDFTYSASVDRATRHITISCDQEFEFLNESGSNLEKSFISLAGFEEADLSGETSYQGTLPSGKVWEPQAPISQYTPFEHWVGVSDASINTSISGRKTIVSFGEESKMECNIYPITNREFLNSLLINNPNAEEDALDFLAHITRGNPCEFMFNKKAPNTFAKCYIESTRDSRDGVSFKLTKHKNFQGIYETGTLTFRKYV